ncbi:MAG TPA: cytochrome c maturation protein CcmE [Solirubrobacteraceae bacterium]|jgi:cytochrome c-type biogenesis protein CcmE
MDPARKRTLRLTIALTCALLLAGALIYTSFASSSAATTPSKLTAGAVAGKTYQLTGKVADGSVAKRGATTEFRVRDRDGTVSVPVRYTGAVPDAFREGREVIVDVRKDGATFVGEKDSLVTKCPSKFSADEQAS